MKDWQADLLTAVQDASDENEVFVQIASAARILGFETCAYGLRLPLPLSNPKVFTLNNYPVAWQQRYREAGYLNIDPTVLHCRRTQAPLIWSDDAFSSARQMWADAQSHGLRVGWAQSSLDANGVGGMLTMSRSADPLCAAELETKEAKMRWLVNVAHLAFARVVAPKLNKIENIRLTEREIEVLKWTADGKTLGEISRILAISVDTVNFHVRNSVNKLDTANKTAAVVRAAMLGWLN